MRAASTNRLVIRGDFTLATLPDVVASREFFAWATDGAPGGTFMLSNGVTWTPVTGDMAPTSFGSPTSRSLIFGSAFQALDPTQPAAITLNLTSTSSNALLSSAQASQKGEVYVAATAAGVTGATGTRIAVHENTQGGVLVVGLTITQTISQTITLELPTGWYFGARQTVGGNLSIASAFDQVVG